MILTAILVALALPHEPCDPSPVPPASPEFGCSDAHLDLGCVADLLPEAEADWADALVDARDDHCEKDIQADSDLRYDLAECAGDPVCEKDKKASRAVAKRSADLHRDLAIGMANVAFQDAMSACCTQSMPGRRSLPPGYTLRDHIAPFACIELICK